MGYCVSVEIQSVRIAVDKVKDCLKAINDLYDPDLMEKQAGGARMSGSKVLEQWYRWVQNPPAGGFTDLPEALEAWRYGSIVMPSGRVALTEFLGEKAGDDEYLFQAIAPFVGEGGFIEFLGEDGERWRVLFDGNAAITQTATIVWE